MFRLYGTPGNLVELATWYKFSHRLQFVKEKKNISLHSVMLQTVQAELFNGLTRMNILTGAANFDMVMSLLKIALKAKKKNWSLVRIAAVVVRGPSCLGYNI